MQYNKYTIDMKKIIAFLLFTGLGVLSANSAENMFDDNGSYSGNWKQMTNVSSSSQSRKTYSSSDYSTSSWYANNNKQRAVNAQNSYSAQGYTQSNTVPFRYNTLNYTRVRKVKGGYGDYNAKCSDIGDVSFCR